MKLETNSLIKVLGITTLGLNTLSFILGIVYLLLSVVSVFWRIFGFVLFINLGMNFFLIYFSGDKVNKQIKKGNNLSILGYIYLVFSILAVFIINLGNLLISLTYTNKISINFVNYLLVILGYFGILGLGCFYSFQTIILAKDESLWLSSKDVDLELSSSKRKRREITKLILFSTSFVGIGFGIFTSISILLGSRIRMLGFFGVGIAQFGITWGFVFICCLIILLKIGWFNNTGLFYPIVAVALVFSTISFLPYFATPFSTNYAMRNFDEAFNPAFGGDWKAEIDIEIEKHFLKSFYSLPLYFLGYKPSDCLIIKDVLYFNGSESSYEVDKNILLYFDVYLPFSYAQGLPGENSVLIRIHGGGWGFGDKGLTNMLQMNRYFAAQGYVVFDIQYGLVESSGSNPFTPEYVQGEFNRTDMIRHIGNFTHFLVQNADVYNANVDSVFVSGGSAGGQLTAAVALGIASGSYSNIFSSNITIKGLIPFYPAIGVYNVVDPFRNPSLLVEQNSPPCLIFQGTQDGLVRPEVSERFLDEYLNAGNTNCSILYMPFAGHANDLYFSGYYTQVFLYFMERFMFLFR